MESLLFKARGGKIIGRDHRLTNKNCQDDFCFLGPLVIGEEAFLVGSVTDGCSEGEKSEVAAVLLAEYVVRQTIHLLRFETPITQIPVTLYPHIVGFLDSLAKMFVFQDSKDKIGFISSHLLATIIGFILGPKLGVVFHAGDGFVVINEQMVVIDHQDKSPYVAYQLIPRSATKLTTNSPMTFATIELKTEELQRLIVATDGFSENLIKRMIRESLPIPLGMQLWLNKINGPRNPYPEDGLFFDDATAVMVERIS